MLIPSAGREGVADFVAETVKNAGDKGCPPYFLGVGVGGTFDTVAHLSKSALIEETMDDSLLKEMIESRCAKLDFGIASFSGSNIVKSLFIKTDATHIATLPVAVTLNCHSFRKGEIVF